MSTDIIPIDRSVFRTGETGLAAALATVGVATCDGTDGIPPVANVYDRERPFHPDAPGHVTYFLEMRSEAGADTRTLALAWSEPGADEALDLGLDALRAALQAGDVGTAREALAGVERVLPLAMVATCRAFATNRATLANGWRKATPMLRFVRGPKSFSIISKAAFDRMTPREKKRFR